MKYLYFLSLVFVFVSCMKEEIPVPAHEAGDVSESTIELGTDYRYQAYYDFETDAFVGQHEKIVWDLGFEASVTGNRIVLNTGKSMSASRTAPGIAFTDVVDTVGANWEYDASSGKLDSTAIGDWQTYSGVYIFDRGYSHDGTHQGFRKAEFTLLNTDEYEIHYANLDGSDEHTYVIEKDVEYNFTFFSFETNAVVSVQPPKEDWDIVFGQYAHMFEPTFPYLVTGVLSNRNKVEVAEVFDKAFADINFADVSEYLFSSDINIIGYDWKVFTGGIYETDPSKNYIVKSTEGLYFKIHFVDFYNDLGDKGNPKFEVVQL